MYYVKCIGSVNESTLILSDFAPVFILMGVGRGSRLSPSSTVDAGVALKLHHDYQSVSAKTGSISCVCRERLQTVLVVCIRMAT